MMDSNLLMLQLYYIYIRQLFVCEDLDYFLMEMNS